MAIGAERNNIHIKYCMALPRQLLTSVMAASVNAARVSEDYRLSEDNWRIGISTYFASALGLAAFKDTFWSSSVNEDHPFYYDCMIGEDEQDPNVPWSVTYRYSGPHSVSSKTVNFFVSSPALNCASTESGKECISWYDLDLHFNAPNNNLERRACRNAHIPFLPMAGEGKPWCFTQADLNSDPASWQWESCDIPICNQHCRRGSGNGDHQHLPLCPLIPEPSPRRQAIVSILSRGGVGPGDRLDNLDHSIIRATARQDGLLLKPDDPAMATPLQILKMAFSGLHDPLHPHAFQIGEIWKTQTTLNGKHVFPLIFLSEVAEVQVATWKELGLTHEGLQHANEYIQYDDVGSPAKLISRSEDMLMLPQVDDCMVIYLSPVWHLSSKSMKVALLGELDKFVPISQERIKSLSFHVAGSLSIKLEVLFNFSSPFTFSIVVLFKGQSGERIKLSFVLFQQERDMQLKEMECDVGDDGFCHISLQI